MEFWYLTQGETVHGTLRDCRVDMPWFVCHFEATAAFGPFRALFEEDARLLENEEMDAWEEAAERIQQLGLVLRSPAGVPDITEFMLHITGSRGWFRY